MHSVKFSDPYFVGTVERLTDCSISTLPSEKSVRNYFAEFAIISAMQTAELLYNNSKVTLGWDATTVKGKHLNEVHFSIVTPEGPVQYLVTIDRVPGARAEDYNTQILRALEKSATLYGSFKNLDPSEVLFKCYR